ncbi:MAG TPA: helix-turn-helix transcriptional regulator [Pyrinomonadaceae bacterium]|nr:helix-turn-helix transcriptional regulator [Pyrinomonadaceae bacterium]
MVKRKRERPERLAEKLLQIRKALGLSQSEMLRRIGKGESGHRNFISNYENGVRLPSLLELLAYARAAGVSVDVLIDDYLDLPKHLPAKRKT